MRHTRIMWRIVARLWGHYCHGQLEYAQLLRYARWVSREFGGPR